MISPEKIIQRETQKVIELFEAGLSVFHLRKPHASKEELIQYLENIPKKYHTRIVLHQHYGLAGKFKIKGVHLPEKKRNSTGAIRSLLRKKIKIVSTSFHSIEEISRSRRKYEYIFLSPVFDSISKKGYKKNFSIEDIRSELSSLQQNIIALGGVSNKNITTLKDARFKGAATIGYVWDSKTPIKKFQTLLSKVK